MPTKNTATVKRPRGVVVQYVETTDADGHVVKVERIVKRKDGRVIGKDI